MPQTSEQAETRAVIIHNLIAQPNNSVSAELKDNHVIVSITPDDNPTEIIVELPDNIELTKERIIEAIIQQHEELRYTKQNHWRLHDWHRCEECEEVHDTETCIFPLDAPEQAYCRECTDEVLQRCEHCGGYWLESDEFEDVYRDYDSYLGHWCYDCQREEHCTWDENDERMYANHNTGKYKMQKFLNPEGILAKGCANCPDCRDEWDGICPRHMRQKMQELEAEATTLWVYDVGRREYHSSEHHRFKTRKLRAKHERPYLYYGIELEVLWQREYDLEKTVEKFIEATNGLFVAEYDRSVDELGINLGNYWGAEFISRPLSYKMWISPEIKKLLEAGLKVLKDSGAMDPQDIGCGLHVHMSKTFFEKNTKKKVTDIKSDLDWFFQFFQPEVEKVSRRPYTKYCASKAFRMQNSIDNFRNGSSMFGVKGKFMMEKGELTRSSGSGITHHDCVIETNKTIEARTFKSTIKVEEILATIEFCRDLAHAARNRVGLTGKTFGEIMYTKDDMYLTEYIRKNRIDTSRKLENKLEVKL